LNKRTNVISHHLITYNLDLLAVTETWLSAESGNSDLLNVCPAGYSAVHTARLGKRGGGVALIHRDSIRVDVVTSGFSCNSFEHIVVLLRFSSISIRLVIVYRPPSQSSKCSEGQFISDFADFLQLLVVSTGKLLIVGDFNIHTDVVTNSSAVKLQSILQSFGLSQHVNGPTHLDGHTLDLVIARDADKVITDCSVSDLICDHFAVHTFVKAHRPPRPRKKITYRELNRIDENSVCTKVFTVRPANPWLTEEVLAKRRAARACERRWRDRKKQGTALEIDRQLVRTIHKEKRKVLDREKAQFLNKEISEAPSKKSLFKIVDSFLIKKPGLKLPRHSSLPEMVERFSGHFTGKVANIRSRLDAARGCPSPADAPLDVPPFSSFVGVTVPEIVALIKECPSKSSSRDPIPHLPTKEVCRVSCLVCLRQEESRMVGKRHWHG
jgi:hypothetical protein